MENEGLRHVPVMQKEVVELLAPARAERIIDCTVGAGGHAAALLSNAPNSAKLLAIDLDNGALAVARKTLAAYKQRVIFYQGNFANLHKIALKFDFIPSDIVFFDLGMSSMQVDDPHRGFSFHSPYRLDMRYNQKEGVPAYVWLNRATKKELVNALRTAGERWATRIAQAIIERRQQQRIIASNELADLVAHAVPRRFWPKQTHPATKTFLALRIVVNDELSVLRQALIQAVAVLAPLGRLGVISFNSAEDSIVKDVFSRESKDCICPPEAPYCVCGHQAQIKVITQKPVLPGRQEVINNPRARSARLRVAQKLHMNSQKALGGLQE